MNKYAFFDIDNTIYKGYSTSEFYLWLVKHQFLDKKIVKENKKIEANYFSGKIDYKTASTEVVALLAKALRGKQTKIVNIWKRKFMEEKYRFFPWVKDVFTLLDENGFEIYLISAAGEPVVKAVADYLQVKKYFASDYEIRNSVYTGKLKKMLNFEEKSKLIHRIVGQLKNNSQIIAFGDSTGDLEMLKVADAAFVINPHEKEMIKISKKLGFILTSNKTILNDLKKILRMKADPNNHQKQQLKVIANLEKQVRSGDLKFSTIPLVKDLDLDPRICLTSVNFPGKSLKENIRENILRPLREISPNHYYYRENSLHLTIKNIRVVNDPPNFSSADVKKVKNLFGKIIPQHKTFYVYFYRLFIFPMNLALIGTTDPELDDIFLDLDQGLKKIGVADDKKYLNSKYFISNVTLVRFTSQITEAYKKKVQEISKSIKISPYKVDSVTLIKSNATLTNCQKIKTWKLM